MSVQPLPVSREGVVLIRMASWRRQNCAFVVSLVSLAITISIASGVQSISVPSWLRPPPQSPLDTLRLTTVRSWVKLGVDVTSIMTMLTFVAVDNVGSEIRADDESVLRS